MKTTYLTLTPHDPLIARDGRPFGAGQGNRMRGLPWPLPSVVAGSFRTALVKAGGGNFSGDMPTTLLEKVRVQGVFPAVGQELYWPAPNDCAWDKDTKTIHRVQPIPLDDGEGVDFPVDGLWPVRLSEQQASKDFKAESLPAWWPASKLTLWLTASAIEYKRQWFENTFLNHPIQAMRDHVALDADLGAAAEGNIFATANLHVTHLPRFGAKPDDQKVPFKDRFAEVTLTARVTIDDPQWQETALDLWHPLGGERRLVHWKKMQESKLWDCPDAVKDALKTAKQIRMVLATPAIFQHGWKPGWLSSGLEGSPPGSAVKLKLVGVCNSRWKAVSGWSLAPPRGPKPIRRMVPAGSVYFFEVEKSGNATSLAHLWLQPVSDDEPEQRDGFGLALWGTW